MISDYEDYICKAIDQRNKDKSVVRKERLRLAGYKKLKKCTWSGKLTLSNRFIRAAL